MIILPELLAPAKLNLFLHVVGRRPDGYHLLQSAFVLIDWCDRLQLVGREDGMISRIDEGPSLPADDLCTRAARALQAASGTALGVNIRLSKHIPQGAGLGGGSSDAATTLLGCNALWQLHWPRERLAELALSLGADVPFFIHGLPAWVEGVGERVTPFAGRYSLPASILERAFVVLKPQESIATATLFASPGLQRDTKSATIFDFLAAAQVAPEKLLGDSVETASVETASVETASVETARVETARVETARVETAASAEIDTRVRDTGVADASVAAELGWWRNDLASVAQAQCPGVATALQWLRLRFGRARMTGSGSAVFAPLPLGGESTAAQALQGLPSGWSARVCRVLPEHPLRGELG